MTEADWAGDRCAASCDREYDAKDIVTTRKSVRHTINVAEESAVSAAREA
jgi:isocitrate lyase